MKTKFLYGTLVVSMLALVTQLAFSTPPGTKYVPGETTDPTCAPGAVNCDVELASGDNIYTANGITGTGRTVGITDTLNFDSNTLFVDGVNNNVGIGTASPGSKLTVSDDAPGVFAASVLQNNQGGSGLSVIATPGAGLSVMDLNNTGVGATAIFQRSGTIDMIINGDGNVGVGVTDPGSRLTVSTDGSSTGGMALVNVAGDTLGNFRSTAGGRGLIQLFDEQGTNALDLRAFNDSANITMYNSSNDKVLQLKSGTLGHDFINTTSNFGLGTDTPGSKLSVVGLQSATSIAGTTLPGAAAGAVCISTVGDMYIDTDGTCN